MIGEYDYLKLYFQYDYVVNPKIVVHQPTIGEIIDYGDLKYWGMISTLCSIPSDRKSELWDAQIDYESITDFDYFRLVSKGLTPKETSIILGDIDLSGFEERINTQNGNVVMYNEEQDIIIDEYLYLKMITFLRMLHNIKPKIEHAANKSTKMLLIDLDRSDKKLAAEKPRTSFLLPLVSALLTHPGFKYTKSQLKEVGLYEFMDSVKQIDSTDRAHAALTGYFTNVDFSKSFDKKMFNWIRDLA